MLLLDVALHVGPEREAGRAVFAGKRAFRTIATLLLLRHQNTVLDDHLDGAVSERDRRH